MAGARADDDDAAAAIHGELACTVVDMDVSQIVYNPQAENNNPCLPALTSSELGGDKNPA